MTRKIDVAVIGSIGIDTNVYLPGGEIDVSVEANFTENRDYVGQAGGYTARGYSKLGMATAFLGHVGADYQGRMVRETLERDGIDTRALFVDPEGTARSVNLMYAGGQRKNFYDGKGHMVFRPDLGVCRTVLAGVRLAHVHLANWGRLLLPVAHELGCVVACDLQDMISLDDEYRQDFIAAADFLFFSSVNQPDPTPWIRALMEKRPEAVVLAGMGAGGCMLGASGQLKHFPIPNLQLPVVDTNGSGDMLAVGFLTSYLFVGCGIEEAVLRGQIAARHTCSLRASTDGLLLKEELERLRASLKTD